MINNSFRIYFRKSTKMQEMKQAIHLDWSWDHQEVNLLVIQIMLVLKEEDLILGAWVDLACLVSETHFKTLQMSKMQVHPCLQVTCKKKTL